jgi:hypothetical protein
MQLVEQEPLWGRFGYSDLSRVIGKFDSLKAEVSDNPFHGNFGLSAQASKAYSEAIAWPRH